MNRLQTESSKDALRLMSLVCSIDPYSLPTSPDEYVSDIKSLWEYAGIKPEYKYMTHEKLWQGISDTADIVHNALDDYNRLINQDEAIAIVTNDISIATIAHAAQLGEKELRSTNRRQKNYNYAKAGDSIGWYSDLDKNPVTARRFIIDDGLGAIIQYPDFDESFEYRSPEKGCPFAHGESKRPKGFDRFVHWAGILVVREYYENQK